MSANTGGDMLHSSVLERPLTASLSALMKPTNSFAVSDLRNLHGGSNHRAMALSYHCGTLANRARLNRGISQ